MSKRSGAHRDGLATTGRMRIMLVELEGSDASIQDGIRAVTSALSGPTQVLITRPALPSTSSGGTESAVAPGSLDEMPTTDPHSFAVEGDVGDPADSPTNNSTTRSVRQKTSPRERNQGIGLDGNLDLRPRGKPSLEEFFADKAPTTLQEQLAVCVYYLKCILEIERANINQVFTCLKHRSIRIPNDLAQAIRNLSNKKKWVDSGDRDDLKMMTAGSNLVEHDLPKQSKKKSA